MDNIKALLIKLLYSKLTQQIESLNISLITVDMALKKYLMYYLDIIPAIQFLLGHQLLISYLVYALVQQ